MKPYNVLMLRFAPPMMLTAKPYYDEPGVRHLANFPYQVTHIRKEPPAPAPSQKPPRDTTQSSPTIVDADQDSEALKQYFLDEE